MFYNDGVSFPICEKLPYGTCEQQWSIFHSIFFQIESYIWKFLHVKNAALKLN